VAIFIHARQSDRSLVFLMRAFGNQMQPPLVFARFYLSTSLPHQLQAALNWEAPLMLPDMILRLHWRSVNGPRLVIGTSGTRCLLPHARSFQLPFQPLQCGGSFICPNHHMAVLAVADAHQNGDVLETFFD
jgi:hypothetical protein